MKTVGQRRDTGMSPVEAKRRMNIVASGKKMNQKQLEDLYGGIPSRRW